MGTGLDLLQWALPLVRVVSPLDVVLNACGAVATGQVVAHVCRSGAARAGVTRPSVDGLVTVP